MRELGSMRRFLHTANGSRLFCLLSGAVFSLSFRWEWAFFAVFPALTFFFLLLFGEEKGLFSRCFCFFAGCNLLLYTWFTALYPLSVYGFSGAVSALIVAFCCIALPLLQALLCAGIWLLTRLFAKEKPLLRALGCGAVWVLTEWVLSLGELAFPWGTLALSQTGFVPLLQTVSVWGVYGLAFAVSFFCALLAEGIRAKGKALLRGAAAFLCAVLTVGTVLYLVPQKVDRTVSVALVQGNSTAEEQWTSAMVAEVYKTYLSMTEEAAKQGAKLIILPETAIAVSFSAGSPLHLALADIAEEYDCTILLGVLQKKEDGIHNGAVAIDPDHTLSEIYEKRHLVPFGEFLPLGGMLEHIFPSLSGLNLTGASLVTEETEAVLHSELYTFGCFICFDSVFTGQDRAVPESDFSVVVTNDGWFKKSSGIYQHLRFSKLRAVEGGKTLLRCGNTGISAVIDAKGGVLASTKPMEPDILYFDAPIGTGTTAYSVVGDTAVLLCGGFLLILLILHLKKRKRYVET